MNGEIDENAWGIEKDDGEFLVIKFKYDKTSLPKKYAFLGDCKGLAYFIQKEDMDMEVKLLGQLVTIQEINEFSNYNKK